MAATNNNIDAEHRPDPTLSIQNRLRLTARVAVGVSLLGSIALLVTFFLLLRDQPDSNYYQIIQSLTRSQEHLAWPVPCTDFPGTWNWKSSKVRLQPRICEKTTVFRTYRKSSRKRPRVYRNTTTISASWSTSLRKTWIRSSGSIPTGVATC
jgi:hypothetical protein